MTFPAPSAKITVSQRCFSTLERGTGISSPVRVYCDSAHAANSHTSPSGEVSMMDVIFTPDFQQRFWLKVIKIPASGCWEWQGTKTQGYGMVCLPGGKSRGAHRVSFLMAGKIIPDGYVIDHLCRNRKCVNPAHLEAVTNAENILRGFSPPAINSRLTHCPKGHEYTEENTYFDLRNQNGRTCRLCWQSRKRTPLKKEAKQRRNDAARQKLREASPEEQARIRANAKLRKEEWKARYLARAALAAAGEGA